MVCSGMKNKLERYLPAVFVFLFVMLLASGCGETSGSPIAKGYIAGVGNGAVSAGAVDSGDKTDNIDKTDIPGDNDSDMEKTGTDKTDIQSTGNDPESVDAFNNNVPVYGKDQKDKIKKYLASLPDNLDKKEAEEMGIIIENYMEEKQSKKEWMDFYKFAKYYEKIYSAHEGAIICFEVPIEAAVVIAKYTIEGDICYYYLSFTEGEYYVYEDCSRDNFKAGSWDGYREVGTYKSLRKFNRHENAEYETGCKDIGYAEFYLFKKRLKKDASADEAFEVIKNGSYHDYYGIFGYVTDCTTYME